MFRHRPFSDLKWISCSKHALIHGSSDHWGVGEYPRVPEMRLLECSIPWGPAPFTPSARALFLWLIELPEEIRECGKGPGNLRGLGQVPLWLDLPSRKIVKVGLLESKNTD